MITSAVFSWTPPTESICISIYTVTLTNITEGNISYIYNTATNTTNMTVSDLTEGAEYLFTVAGVDAEGTVGEESVPSQTVRLQSQYLQKMKSNMNILQFSFHFRLISTFATCILPPLSHFSSTVMDSSHGIFLYNRLQCHIRQNHCREYILYLYVQHYRQCDQHNSVQSNYWRKVFLHSGWG